MESRISGKIQFSLGPFSAGRTGYDGIMITMTKRRFLVLWICSVSYPIAMGILKVTYEQGRFYETFAFFITIAWCLLLCAAFEMAWKHGDQKKKP